MGDFDKKTKLWLWPKDNRSLKKSSLVMRKLQVMKQPKLYLKRGGKDHTELHVARTAKQKTFFRLTVLASGRNQQWTISQKNTHYTLKASSIFTPQSAQNEWLQAARNITDCKSHIEIQLVVLREGFLFLKSVFSSFRMRKYLDKRTKITRQSSYPPQTLPKRYNLCLICHNILNMIFIQQAQKQILMLITMGN